MQGDISLVTYHPAIVWNRRYVKESSSAQLDDATIVECGSGDAGKDQSDMFDDASRGIEGASDVFGPLPTGFITCPSKRQTAQSNDFEPALLECPDFIGFLEASENQV